MPLGILDENWMKLPPELKKLEPQEPREPELPLLCLDLLILRVTTATLVGRQT